MPGGRGRTTVLFLPGAHGRVPHTRGMPVTATSGRPDPSIGSTSEAVDIWSPTHRRPHPDAGSGQADDDVHSGPRSPLPGACTVARRRRWRVRVRAFIPRHPAVGGRPERDRQSARTAGRSRNTWRRWNEHRDTRTAAEGRRRCDRRASSSAICGSTADSGALPEPSEADAEEGIEGWASSRAPSGILLASQGVDQPNRRPLAEQPGCRVVAHRGPDRRDHGLDGRRLVDRQRRTLETTVAAASGIGIGSLQAVWRWAEQQQPDRHRVGTVSRRSAGDGSDCLATCHLLAVETDHLLVKVCRGMSRRRRHSGRRSSRDGEDQIAAAALDVDRKPGRSASQCIRCAIRADRAAALSGVDGSPSRARATAGVDGSTLPGGQVAAIFPDDEVHLLARPQLRARSAVAAAGRDRVRAVGVVVRVGPPGHASGDEFPDGRDVGSIGSPAIEAHPGQDARQS